MKNKLIQLIQNAIHHYVIRKEGNKYRGSSFHYDLEYIKKSPHIPARRKNDIETIDYLITESLKKKTDISSLVSAILRYLEAMPKGWYFLCIHGSPNKSWLKDYITQAIQAYNKNLYQHCIKNKDTPLHLIHTSPEADEEFEEAGENSSTQTLLVQNYAEEKYQDAILSKQVNLIKQQTDMTRHSEREPAPDLFAFFQDEIKRKDLLISRYKKKINAGRGQKSDPAASIQLSNPTANLPTINLT